MRFCTSCFSFKTSYLQHFIPKIVKENNNFHLLRTFVFFSHTGCGNTETSLTKSSAELLSPDTRTESESRTVAAVFHSSSTGSDSRSGSAGSRKSSAGKSSRTSKSLNVYVTCFQVVMSRCFQ